MTTPDDSGTNATLADSGDTSNSEQLPRGSNLGRYVIIEPIGSGGMGTVYRAYDPQLNRGVALKILSVKQEDFQAAERAKARLIREAQALAQLSHPNVVAVHDAGTFEDDVFIAMELVEGKTLDDWLNEQKRSVKEILKVMIAAGTGLSAAHKAGLVHRDFKPGNVMIGNDGRVRVLDFGLARAADQQELNEGGPEVAESDERSQDSKDPFGFKEISSDSSPNLLESPLTNAGGVLGTPLYMAPEQHLGLKTDERTDQFGFCVVLYEALYGKRPFLATSMERLKREVVRQQVCHPRTDTDVPSWLWKIIHKGLSAKPEDRYAAIDVLLEDLDKDPEEVRRQKRLTRRRNLFVALLILLTIALPFGVWYGLRYRTFQLCKDAEVEFEGVWDDATRASVKTAFLGTEKSYARGTWERVELTFKNYLADWTQMRSDVCEARLIRGTQSEELFDLRMSCLRKRIVELGALVEVFEKADAGVVQKAVQASALLTGINICANEDALRAPYPPPKDEATKSVVSTIREKLVRVGALSNAGRYKEGLALSKNVLNNANELGYLPVQAEAKYVMADLLERAGKFKEAKKNLEDAVNFAERASHDEIRAKALVSLLLTVGYCLSHFEQALELNRRVEAIVMRFEGNWQLRSNWLNSLGNVFWSHNDWEKALDCYQGSLVIRERELGREHLDVARILNNIGNVYKEMGEYAEALHFHKRALKAKQRVLGPKHPSVARSLNNIGNVIYEMGDTDQALDYYTEALALRENTLGPNHPEVASTRNNLGIVFLAMGNYDLSIQNHQKALEIREKTLGPSHMRVSWVLAGLGWSYLRKGDVEKSVPAFERALQICASENANDDIRCRISKLGLGFAVWHVNGHHKRAVALVRIGLKLLNKERSIRVRKLCDEATEFLRRHDNGS